MPIDTVRIDCDIPHVSILDEHGSLDEALEPDVPARDLRELYRTMLLARAYDDRRLTLQRQGRIGTFAPVKGQEAAQLGSAYALRDTDWTVPAFRETAVGLWRGLRLENDLLYCAGFEEGVNLPEDARDLPISIPVASQIPHATGLAWARRLRGTDEVVMCYFGDGATSEGDFHEGLNLAQVFRAPVVFLCQNNHYAISVPRVRQTASGTLAQKAVAYGMRGVVVDGNDLLAVIHASREAVERARRGEGPTLVEAVTYRLSVHTTADDPAKYRSADEVETWSRRDPLPRLRAHLARKGLLDEREEREWAEDIARRVAEAVRRFEARAAPDPLAMFEHQWDELPPYVARQRDDLARHARRRGAAQAEPPPPLPGQLTGSGIGVPDRDRLGDERRAREVEE